jgi:RNA polymerase sigma-70 factor, ECF subfamily
MGMPATTCSTADLTTAAAGDEEAFASLFRSHQPMLLRYLRTLAPGAQDDLAAETWLRVVRALANFDGDLDDFRAWLFTIAHRRYVDHVRAMTRRPPQLDESAALDLPSRARVEEEVEAVLSTERALELIGRLAPDQAEVLVLRVVADLDVAATARVVGKSRGAVRVLAHRGLRRLSRILADEGLRVEDDGGQLGPAAERGVTEQSRATVTGES